MNNLNTLLSGKVLLKEISPLMPGYRTWIEISLIDELKPSYPFRLDEYAMIGHSPYANECNKDDYVGKYEIIASLNELKTRLSTLHVNLEQFINSSEDDEYPL